jgi:hypothetical protein
MLIRHLISQAVRVTHSTLTYSSVENSCGALWSMASALICREFSAKEGTQLATILRPTSFLNDRQVRPNLLKNGAIDVRRIDAKAQSFAFIDPKFCEA